MVDSSLVRGSFRGILIFIQHIAGAFGKSLDMNCRGTFHECEQTLILSHMTLIAASEAAEPLIRLRVSGVLLGA